MIPSNFMRTTLNYSITLAFKQTGVVPHILNY